ncbi:MAG: long-chain-fatty-acid--CoA ligase [Burkholderiaceae bacterium]
MLTFGQLARHNARNYPAKTAYVDGERRIDWARLNERACRLAQFLLAAGVARGDRVASISCDCIELVEIVVACAKIGAVRVGINHRYAPPEIEHILDDSGVRVVFVQGALAGPIAEIAPRLHAAPTLVGFEGAHPFAADYETVLAGQAAVEPGVAIGDDDLGYIFYSSGSTGRPKGVTTTWRQVMDSLCHIALNEGSGRSDVWLHTMPAGGIPLLILMRAIYHGATCVIMRRWDPEQACALIERERVTRTLVVPTMLVSLIHHPDARRRDLSSLRQIAYGAAPCTPANIRLTMEVFPGVEMLQMYGATEATGMATMLFPEDHREALRTCDHDILSSAGKPVPYMEVVVADERGEPVAAGEVGEVLIRGALVTSGYWNAPLLTAEAVRDGWLHTGDMGRFDHRGYLHLVDRKKFMIVSGGYNVYPVEVENALAQHPAVKEVAVIGVPDPRWGEAVKAIVTLRPGRQASEAELLGFCQERIAGYKAPKTIEFIDEFPRSAVGKLDKRALRERHWQGGERRIGG